MRCRNCGRTEPIGLSYVCPGCFGPLEVAYDYDLIGADADPRRHRAARRPASGATPSCSRSTRRRSAVLAGRVDAAARRPTASPRVLGVDRLWIKDDTRNPSLSFKDRAVAIAAARAVEFGVEALCLRLDREPGRCDGRGGGGRRAARLRLHPGRPRAGQGRPRPRLRRDRGPDRRHVRRREPALPRGRRRDRLGLRQHQPAAVLRRGLQDPRLRDRRVARLALAGRRRRRRSPRARCSRGSPAASRSSPSSA